MEQHKHDEGKSRLGLVPPGVIEAVTRGNRLTGGKRK